MRINRNSWHYKIRKNFYVYNGWENIIEPEISIITYPEYCLDVFVALLCYIPAYAMYLASKSNVKIEFYEDKKCK